MRIPLLGLLVALLVDCAPPVPSAADRAHASDLLDQAALEHQLLALPGVTGAHATLHRSFIDPLTGSASPASASVVVNLAHAADRGAIETAAHQLAPTAAIVLAEAPAPVRSRPVAPIAALLAILGAAGYVAWRTRPSRAA